MSRASVSSCPGRRTSRSLGASACQSASAFGDSLVASCCASVDPILAHHARRRSRRLEGHEGTKEEHVPCSVEMKGLEARSRDDRSRAFHTVNTPGIRSAFLPSGASWVLMHPSWLRVPLIHASRPRLAVRDGCAIPALHVCRRSRRREDHEDSKTYLKTHHFLRELRELRELRGLRALDSAFAASWFFVVGERRHESTPPTVNDHEGTKIVSPSAHAGRTPASSSRRRPTLRRRRPRAACR